MSLEPDIILHNGALAFRFSECTHCKCILPSPLTRHNCPETSVARNTPIESEFLEAWSRVLKANYKGPVIQLTENWFVKLRYPMHIC